MRILIASILLALISVSSFSHAATAFKDVYAKYNEAIAAKDYQVAVEYARKALEMGKIKFADSPENVLNLEHNLALAYAENKQAKKAFEMMLDVTDKNRALFGEHSEAHFYAQLDTLGVMQKLGIQKVSKMRSQGRRLITAAAQSRDILAQNADQNATILNYLFAKQLNVNPLSSVFFDRAMQATKLAEETLMASVGESDVRTIEMQYKLGQFNSALKNRNKAIAYFETVVSSVNNAIDTSHPYELAAHANLVRLYEKKGESDKATKHCLAIGQIKPWQDDIDQIPLYRIEPRYPLNYAKKGREGSVIIEFGIDSFGFVVDPVVVEVDGGSLFAREAQKAVEKWRYAPKVVDGKAVNTQGHKVQLDFRIDS